MSNMSYCRFENTSLDLADCNEALESLLNCEGGSSLSEHELNAAVRLFGLCKDFLSKIEDHLTGNGIDVDSIMDFNNDREVREQLASASAAVEAYEQEEEGCEDMDEPPC